MNEVRTVNIPRIVFLLLMPLEGLGVLIFFIYVFTHWSTFIGQTASLYAWCLGFFALVAYTGLALLVVKVVKAGIEAGLVLAHGAADVHRKFVDNRHAHAQIELLRTEPNYVVYRQKGELVVQNVLPPASQRQLKPGTYVEEEQQRALPPGGLPTKIHYEEVQHLVPQGRALLGVSQNGIETCDFSALMTMWICGGSSTGKSNTVALKIDEAIRNGRDIKLVVIDPHARKDDSLYNKIRCYEDRFLFRVAVTEQEIYSALKWFHREFKRRLEAGGGETDILLVCDEVSNVVASEDERIKPLVKEIARICGQESRGFGMFGWFISQKAAGLAWLRNMVITVIAHKMNMMSERKLAANDDTAIARGMDQWPRGRVVIYGIEFEPTITQMPIFTPPAIEATARILPLPDEQEFSDEDEDEGEDETAEYDAAYEMEALQTRQGAPTRERDTDGLLVDEDLREAYEAYQNGATGPRSLQRELGTTYYQAQQLFIKLKEKGLVPVID